MIKRVSIFIIVFASSLVIFLIAKYVGEQQFSITKQVDRVLKVLNINVDSIESVPEVKHQQLFLESAESVQTLEGKITLLTYNCQTPLPIKVEFDHVKGVYIWTDPKGIPHYSDMKPLVKC